MKDSAKSKGSISGDGARSNAEDGGAEASQVSNFEPSQGLAKEGFDKNVESNSGEDITSTGGLAGSFSVKTENNRKRKRTEVSLRHRYLNSYLKNMYKKRGYFTVSLPK